MQVHFENVGRDKKCWTSDVQTLSTLTLRKEIHKHKALMSRYVELSMDIDGETTVGLIFAGFRRVGSFRINGKLALKMPAIEL